MFEIRIDLRNKERNWNIIRITLKAVNVIIKTRVERIVGIGGNLAVNR